MTDAEIKRIAEGLSEAAISVLGVLGADDDFGYHSFKHISNLIGMERDEVSSVIESIKPLGLVTYGSGLATDDGKFYGSGYAASPLGLAVRDYLEKSDDMEL